MKKYMLAFIFFLPLTLLAQTNSVFEKLVLLHEAEDYEAVIKMESALLELTSRTDTTAAAILYYLADANLKVGDVKKAVTFFEQEKKMREKFLPDGAHDYDVTLFNLTDAYLQADDYQNGKAVGKLLVEFDQKTYGVSSIEYISSVLNYVDILKRAGEAEEAEKTLEQIMKQFPDGAEEKGTLLSKQADMCSFLGKYTKAERLFSIALEGLSISDGEDSESYNVTLSNYAQLLMRQGKYDQAADLLDQILAATNKQEGFDEGNYYNTLNSQAFVMRKLGQYSTSEITYRKIMSHDSATIGVDHPDFSIALSNLGLLYLDEGKLVEAEKILKESLEKVKSKKEAQSASYARKLNNLAKAYQYAGKYNEAVSLLLQAQKIFEKQSGKLSPEYATATFNLGSVYLYQKSSKALDKLKEAREIRGKLLGKSHPSYAECEERIAQYYWMKKNKGETGSLYKNVFDNYYGQIDNFFPILTEEEKANFFFQKVKPSVETYASFTISQGNDPQLLGPLFDYHVNTKGLILQATEKVRKSILLSGDSSLMALYEKWENAKDVLTYYYSVHQSQSIIDSLVQVSNGLEKELMRKSSSFAKNLDRGRINWKVIQSKLKPGEAALECLRYRIFNVDSLQFTNQVGYAFLLLTSETNEGPVLIHLANGNDLENRYLKYYRNGIRLKVDDIYTFKSFWEPIHDQLTKYKIKKVFFSPDGVYNTINISSIRNPFSNQYLIDEVDIRRVTSTRTLLEEASIKKNRGVGYLLGFPDYKVDARTQQHASGNSVTNGSRSFRGGMLRLLRNGEGIPPLPGTKVEVEQISTSIKKQFESVELKLETNAIESEVKKLSNPSLLHIATHGYFLDEEDGGSIVKMPNPLLMSGLIMAGAENFIQTGHNPLQEHDDGILTAYEAMNLNLDETDLVVLSACETGLGKVQAGEGVYGLQRAFQVAGAQSIIMSLWSVDDTATQLLMANFYDQYLKTNDLYGSFRIAQQKLKDKYPQPFYWGAFILVGKGE